MRTLTLKAPAKVNLYLNILSKRPDGFHDIETIFEKIDLCDEITLKKRKRDIGIKVLCKHKDLPHDKRNLAFKAAKLLLAKTNRDEGVQIRITKNIPVASGLGGGSSDAASVLLGLNKLLGTGLLRRELLDLAVQLGADVPFFILPNRRALGRGKGEVLTPLRLAKRNWYVLVIPRLKVSSRRMYREVSLTLTKKLPNVKIVLCALDKGDLTALNKYSYNSFEPVLRKKYRCILEVKSALKSFGVGTTLISGSGPCVFGVVQTRKEAIDISKGLQARKKNWQIIVAKTYSNNNEKHS